MSKITRLAASLAIGLAAAGCAGAAMAGYDDGGARAFFTDPGPGAYMGAPASAAEAQPAAPALQGNGYTATVNAPLYNSYRADRHRNRYMIQPQ